MPSSPFAFFDFTLRQYAPAEPAARPFADPALKTWVAEQPDAEALIAQGLTASRREPEVLRAYALAAQRRPDRRQTAALCAALDARDPAVDHDAILAALAWINDPAAVDSLARAIALEPPGDEWGEFGGRAIVVLERIGTPQAAAAIDRALHDEGLDEGNVEVGVDACRVIASRLRTLERLQAARPAGLPGPASEAQVRRLEAQAGHPMPPLLRRVYLEVADGGWGPEPGVHRIEDALRVHRASPLSAELVPLLDAGSVGEYWVDYRETSGPMSLIDPSGPGGATWNGFLDEFADRRPNGD